MEGIKYPLAREVSIVLNVQAQTDVSAVHYDKLHIMKDKVYLSDDRRWCASEGRVPRCSCFSFGLCSL